jgi:hypothetical protein
MSTANPSINPVIVTNFPGSFSVTSDGYVQGIFLDDPAIRNELAGGFLATAETLPMWGGVAIADAIPNPANQSDALGGAISRALAQTGLTGFSVFNQASNMIQTPQSRVPLSGTGMGVNFFRLGSGARICVQCDATFAATLAGESVITQCSWDYTNQKLVAYDSTAALPVKILNVNIGNSKIVSYSSGTGFANWTNNGDVAVIQI